MKKYRLVKKGERIKVGDYWVVCEGFSVVGERYDGLGALKRPIKTKAKKQSRLDLQGYFECLGLNDAQNSMIRKFVANNYRRRVK